MTNVHWKSGKKSSNTEQTYLQIESVRWNVHLRSNIWSPPTDLFETQTHYIARVELAGMRQAAFSILIEDNFLIIKGSRPEPVGRKAFHQMEVRFGEFSSIINIPGPIDEAGADAEYLDGFLTITLPKLIQKT